ncbi:7955_t:CDS:2 [Ambispora gerdemannii]|uniref:7955_t:CDS:1 n=1 Tax=Ambispora gerdemannii TaxID=144530 RepID=A0A9N9BBN8_9GLOM|nr:7955_t:CDS:2 [Ambispora gerdemannii]
MANTQAQRGESKDSSKIDSLKELNSKLLAEITNLRKENAEIPELRKKFSEVEAENNELKAENVIDQSSVCEAGYSVSNSTSNKMENSDSRSEVAIASEPSSRRLSHANVSASDISDNISNPDICHESPSRYLASPIRTETVVEQRHYHDKSSEDREMDDFHDSVYKERVNKEIIQSIGEKKIRDQESLTTLPEEERPQDLNLDAQSRNNTSSEVSANSDEKLPLVTNHVTKISETLCPGKILSEDLSKTEVGGPNDSLGSKSHGSAIDSNLEESETRSFASSPDDNKSYDGDTNDNGDFDVNQLPVENFFDDDSRGEDANATRDNENDDEFSDNNEEEDDGGYCGFSDDDEGYYYDLNTGETYTKSEYRYSIRAY